MLRNELGAPPKAWIARGHINLAEYHTLGEVRKRLLTDQAALRELIADGISQLNIDGWQRDLDLIELDLRRVNALIGQYGEWACLA